MVLLSADNKGDDESFKKMRTGHLDFTLLFHRHLQTSKQPFSKPSYFHFILLVPAGKIKSLKGENSIIGWECSCDKHQQKIGRIHNSQFPTVACRAEWNGNTRMNEWHDGTNSVLFIIPPRSALRSNFCSTENCSFYFPQSQSRSRF